MVHAFGFSTEHFRYFRDEHNQPRDRLLHKKSKSTAKNDRSEAISESIVRTVNRTNWSIRDARVTRPVTLIVTPRVVVSEQFNF
jgi:hypothetical protein